MSMETFKSFAVVGPGHLTQHVIDALLERRQSDPSVQVRILTRPTSQTRGVAASWASLGATFHAVIHERSHPSLIAALQGVEVVISGFSFKDPFAQVPLALTAKETGAASFFPCEFGCDAEAFEDLGPYYQQRILFRRWLDGEGGWNGRWIRYHTGVSSDKFFADYMSFDIFHPTRVPRVVIIGAGNAPMSFTSPRDVGSFLAYVVARCTKSRLLELASDSSSNALRLEGSRMTVNEMLDMSLSLMKDPENVQMRRPSYAEFLSFRGQELQVADIAQYDGLGPDGAGMGTVGVDIGGNWKDWRTDGWRPATLKESVILMLHSCGRLARPT